jgi:hypothetical protein
MKWYLYLAQLFAGERCFFNAVSTSVTGGQRQSFVAWFNQLDDTIETVFSAGKDTTANGFNLFILLFEEKIFVATGETGGIEWTGLKQRIPSKTTSDLRMKVAFGPNSLNWTKNQFNQNMKWECWAVRYPKEKILLECRLYSEEIPHFSLLRYHFGIDSANSEALTPSFPHLFRKWAEYLGTSGSSSQHDLRQSWFFPQVLLLLHIPLKQSLNFS